MEGERPLLDLRRKFGLQGLRVALGDLVLDSHMQALAALILFGEHPVEVIGQERA